MNYEVNFWGKKIYLRSGCHLNAILVRHLRRYVNSGFKKEALVKNVERLSSCLIGTQERTNGFC
jgi:hypothetical protein